MPTSGSTGEPRIPDPGPLVEDLLDVAAKSLRRSSEQAQRVWNQIASGDYEPKHMFRDTAAFWAGAAKDVAKAFVMVRDFLVEVAKEDDQEAAR